MLSLQLLPFSLSEHRRWNFTNLAPTNLYLEKLIKSREKMRISIEKELKFYYSLSDQRRWNFANLAPTFAGSMQLICPFASSYFSLRSFLFFGNQSHTDCFYIQCWKKRIHHISSCMGWLVGQRVTRLPRRLASKQ